MTTAILQSLSKGFHEIASGQWTWREMRNSFFFADNRSSDFGWQMPLVYPVSLWGIADGLYDLTQDLEPLLAGKYRRIVQMSALTWVGGVAIPPGLNVVIDTLHKSTPYLILMTKVGITMSQVFNNPKQTILELGWTAVVFAIPSKRSRLTWCFHHFVFIPMAGIRIYHSNWPDRCCHITVLALRTLRHYPSIQQKLKPFVLKELHLPAMAIGLIPFNLKEFFDGVAKFSPELAARLKKSMTPPKQL